MQKVPQWVRSIPPEIGAYLAGFADGEGSFNASLRRRPDHVRGWQFILTFNVSQKERHILEYYQTYLRCGRIQTRPDGVSMYVVTDYQLLQERIIPFFERFRFHSQKKQRAFSLFRTMTTAMNRGEHLTEDGFRRLVELREQLNRGKGRKRKYGVQDVFLPSEESSETTRRTLSPEMKKKR